MNRFERGFDSIVFNSRWLAAPFILGLILGLIGLLYKFLVKLVEFVWQLRGLPNSDALVSVLGLVDLSLAANLTLIVIWSSYENFVRPIDPSDHPDMPHGLTSIGFSLLKQKLLGSIVAISAVHVLEWFMDIDHTADTVTFAWLIGTMIAFAVVMLVVAAADRMSEARARADH
ncbi:YqhA family protein [Methylocapsa acidiphila]|uniref:YqhA family protein n=1 Tax=Methylocapsa acidiphila TaxID=133552 RepID=UPI0003FB8A10|nr:YqhA family protein [Methylocapsa acidiphila]